MREKVSFVCLPLVKHFSKTVSLPVIINIISYVETNRSKAYLSSKPVRNIFYRCVRLGVCILVAAVCVCYRLKIISLLAKHFCII